MIRDLRLEKMQDFSLFPIIVFIEKQADDNYYIRRGGCFG